MKTFIMTDKNNKFVGIRHTGINTDVDDIKFLQAKYNIIWVKPLNATQTFDLGQKLRNKILKIK